MKKGLLIAIAIAAITGLAALGAYLLYRKS